MLKVTIMKVIDEKYDIFMYTEYFLCFISSVLFHGCFLGENFQNEYGVVERLI